MVDNDPRTDGGGQATPSSAAKRHRVWRSASIALVALLACGGNDSTATCEGFAPCGGDPVGRWTAVSTCTSGTSDDETFFLQQCPEGTFELYAQTMGQLVIEEGGTFDFELAIVTGIELDYPPSCVDSLATCSDLDEICMGEPSTGCHCSYRNTEASTEASEWTVMGAVLDLDGVAAEYCAVQNRLTLRIAEAGGAIYTIAFERD